MAEKFTPTSLSHEDLHHALGFAVEAFERVGGTLKLNFGKTTYQTKEDAQSWVTEWDVWAEEEIRGVLSGFSADIGIKGEELGASGSPDVYWSVDPIDATSHMVRGNDFCVTMGGLVDHGQPVLAVLHDFIRGDTYTALAGEGSYVNHTPLNVSNRPLAESQLEIYTDDESEIGQELIRRLKRAGAFFMSTAAAGHTFIRVARGSGEGFIMLENPYGAEYDIVPGALLVHEAGGTVTNVGTDTYDSMDFDVIAGNVPVAAEIAEILADIRRM